MEQPLSTIDEKVKPLEFCVFVHQFNLKYSVQLFYE